MSVRLEITIDIGDGREGVVCVRDGDSVLDLARTFVQEHLLSDAVVRPLSKHIRRTLQKLEHDGPGDVGSGAVDTPFIPRINTSSIRMLSAPGSRSETFDRLHHHAAVSRERARARSRDSETERAERLARSKRGMSKVSRSLAAPRSGLNGAANYGDKLYKEGVMHQKQKVELLEEIRVQEEEKKLREQGLTFRPTITRRAAAKKPTVMDNSGQTQWQKHEQDLLLMQELLDLNDALPISRVLGTAEHLLELESYGNLRGRIQRVWHAFAELRECTFQPMTSVASSELARAVGLTTSDGRWHERLAADGKERKLKIESYSTSAYERFHNQKL